MTEQKLTRQETLNPEQTEIIQTMQSSFYAKKTQNKIAPQQPMMESIEPLTEEGIVEPAMEVIPGSE